LCFHGDPETPTDQKISEVRNSSEHLRKVIKRAKEREIKEEKERRLKAKLEEERLRREREEEERRRRIAEEEERERERQARYAGDEVGLPFFVEHRIHVDFNSSSGFQVFFSPRNLF
jgi:hypothetical protein